MRFLLVGCMLVACTHHRPLTALREAAGEEVVAQNHRGQTQPARVIVGPGGVPELHSPIGVLPAHQVAQVEEKRHGQGALEGLGLGVLAGGGLGILIGLASGDDGCTAGDDCVFSFTAGEKAMILGVVFGGAGGLVGLIAGAMMGSTVLYEEGPTVVRPVGPPGSAAGVSITF